MASSEKVKAIEALGKQFGVAKVVALFVDSDAGVLTMASWGRNRWECQQVAELGEVLYDEAMEFFRRRLNFDMLGTQE
jgi:hypothetical protein